MTIESYGGCDVDKLLARGLAVRNCYAPTEEPCTGKAFYLCTAGHMHHAFRIVAYRPGDPYWHDSERMLEGFGFDPAFHEAFESAWAAAEAQVASSETDDEAQYRLFCAMMTVRGYGEILDDSEEEEWARLNALAAEGERRRIQWLKDQSRSS